MVESTTAAGIISQIARGFCSLLTKSLHAKTSPSALSFAKSSTAWETCRKPRRCGRPSSVAAPCWRPFFQDQPFRVACNSLSFRKKSFEAATYARGSGGSVVRRTVVRECGSSLLSSSGMMRCASTLPSSTPHWSNESMPQIVPCGEDDVLIERDQLAERLRRQLRRPGWYSTDGCLRTPGAAPANPECPRPSPASGGLAERQRLGLREDVGQQHVVMPSERIERLVEPDEVARDEPRALMNQLIERMLTVGSRLAPVDRPSLVVRLPCRRA